MTKLVVTRKIPGYPKAPGDFVLIFRDILKCYVILLRSVLACHYVARGAFLLIGRVGIGVIIVLVGIEAILPRGNLLEETVDLCKESHIVCFVRE
jgi:hypothetical protein